MAMLSPMRGSRPWRAAQVFVGNVPNPAMLTISPFASASLMVENSAVDGPVRGGPGQRRFEGDARH